MELEKVDLKHNVVSDEDNLILVIIQIYLFDRSQKNRYLCAI